MKAFPKKENFAELTRRMIEQKKRDNETYIDYYYEKIALLRKLRSDGQKAVDCFADGIQNPFVRS